MKKNKILFLAVLVMVWVMVYYSESGPKAFPSSQLDLSTRFAGQIFTDENPVLTNYVSVPEDKIMGLKSTKVYLVLINRVDNPTFLFMLVDTSTVPLRFCQGSFYIESDRHHHLKKWTLEGRVLKFEWARERWTIRLVFATVIIFFFAVLTFLV